MARAKRGDLVALIATQRDYVIGQATRERTTVEIHEVTSITRDGAVKAVRRLDSEHSTPIDRCHGVTQRLIIPATTIDKSAAVQTVLSHTWAGHAQLKPYDSIDEARAALRPHLIRDAGSAAVWLVVTFPLLAMVVWFVAATAGLIAGAGR